MLVSILLVTLAAWWLGDSQFSGIVAMPPSLAPTFMQLDFASAFTLSILPVVLTLLFLDLFDTSGTLVAVTQKAGLLQPDGKVPDLSKALIADSSASMVGLCWVLQPPPVMSRAPVASLQVVALV